MKLPLDWHHDIHCPNVFCGLSKLFLFSWHRRGGSPLLFLGNLLCVEKQIRWKKQSLPKPSWKAGYIQLAYTPSDMLWVFGGNLNGLYCFSMTRSFFVLCVCFLRKLQKTPYFPCMRKPRISPFQNSYLIFWVKPRPWIKQFGRNYAQN